MIFKIFTIKNNSTHFLLIFKQQQLFWFLTNIHAGCVYDITQLKEISRNSIWYNRTFYIDEHVELDSELKQYTYNAIYKYSFNE